MQLPELCIKRPVLATVMSLMIVLLVLFLLGAAPPTCYAVHKQFLIIFGTTCEPLEDI